MSKENKTKLFLYAVFFVLLFVFVVEVYRFVRTSVDGIGLQQKKMDCTLSEIRILKFDNIGTSSVVQLSLSKGSSNITRITISKSGGISKEILLDAPLKKGEFKTLTIENFTSENDMRIYPEDCIENAKA